MKLRGALFGCGMISEFHLRGWNRIPEVEIIALCNRTLSKAKRRRDQFVPLARLYSDLETLLEKEQLDFIDILTPPALHYEHCLTALEAGLHVICQKPLSNDLEQARDLVRRVADSPKVFAVHENHRYRPWFQRIHDDFQANRYGKPAFLHIQHLNATHPAEAYKNEAGEGILFEYGSHLVDMMRSLLGDPTRVYARLHRPNANVRAESLAHVVYEYPDTTVVIDVGWKSGGITQGSLLLVGGRGEAFYEGTLTRGQNGRLRIVDHGQVASDEIVSPHEAYVDSFYLLQRECVEAIEGKGKVTQTAAEHLATLEATFAAYESARRGGVVEVSDMRSGNE